MHVHLAEDFKELTLKQSSGWNGAKALHSPASSEDDSGSDGCTLDSLTAALQRKADESSSNGSDLVSLTATLQRKASEKLIQLRRPEHDPACRIAEGLFIGGVGAARDWEALHQLGVTHVVNASPIVPCFHRKKLRYRAITVYDDGDEDISQYFEITNAFIAKGRRKGAVLVHCYAGQSRSTTLVIAYLIAREKMSLTGALHAVTAVRPCACPNAGFLQQLEAYSAALHASAGIQSKKSGSSDGNMISAIY